MLLIQFEPDKNQIFGYKINRKIIAHVLFILIKSSQKHPLALLVRHLLYGGLLQGSHQCL